MRKKSIIRFLKCKYELLLEKKYSTLAGTLVYFLIMSIMPFAVWITIFLGKMELPIEKILEMPVFESVKDIILYFRTEAMKQQKSASIFFLITALYSATSFLYHLRRSGEIIYGFKRLKSGIKIRISAVAFLFLIILFIGISVGFIAIGAYFTAKLFSTWLSTILDYLILIFVCFWLVLVLNFYVCPYRVRVRELLKGAIVTDIAWAFTLIGFSFYLKIGNTSAVYGAISTIIVFMLWLYVLMICFVIGVIINSTNITTEEEKKL